MRRCLGPENRGRVIQVPLGGRVSAFMPGQQAEVLKLHLDLLYIDVVCDPGQKHFLNMPCPQSDARVCGPAQPWALFLNLLYRDTQGELGEQTLVGDNKYRRDIEMYPALTSLHIVVGTQCRHRVWP